MKEFAPPLCLVLSLLLFIGAFAMLARDRPQPSVALHRARVEGDDDYRDVLEAQLDRQRFQRNVLIGSLFGMAGLMAVAAFAVMRPPH